MNVQASSGSQTPEMVAFFLFERVLQGDERLNSPRVSRTVLLDLFAECLAAVKGERAPRAQRVNDRAA